MAYGSTTLTRGSARCTASMNAGACAMNDRANHLTPGDPPPAAGTGS